MLLWWAEASAILSCFVSFPFYRQCQFADWPIDRQLPRIPDATSTANHHGRLQQSLSTLNPGKQEGARMATSILPNFTAAVTSPILVSNQIFFAPSGQFDVR